MSVFQAGVVLAWLYAMSGVFENGDTVAGVAMGTKVTKAAKVIGTKQVTEVVEDVKVAKMAKVTKRRWDVSAGLLGAVVAAIASSLCCVGPLVYLVFGISAAGLSGLQKLGWLQWPMMGVALALLAMGFWRLYISPKPYCSAFVSRGVMLVLYWLTVLLVMVLLFYPFFLPYVLEWLQ